MRPHSRRTPAPTSRIEPMTATDPAARAAELRAKLDDANHRYHVLDAPDDRATASTT